MKSPRKNYRMRLESIHHEANVGQLKSIAGLANANVEGTRTAISRTDGKPSLT